MHYQQLTYNLVAMISVETWFSILLIGMTVFLMLALQEKLEIGTVSFFTAILLLMIYSKLPRIYSGQSTVDEAQYIAGAITLLEDPRYWLSVDTATSGPLNVFVLLIIKLTGLPVDFFTARILSYLMWCVAIISMYLSLSMHVCRKMAAVLMVPIIFVFCLLDNKYIFVRYLSETLPALMTALAIYTYTRYKTRNKLSFLLISGIIVGSLPYSKLQSAPIAVAFAAFILFSFRGDINTAAKYIGSVALPSVIMLIYLLSSGAIYDFWNSYILGNVLYSKGPYWSTEPHPGMIVRLLKFPKLLFMNQLFGCFSVVLLLTTVLIIIIFYIKKMKIEKIERESILLMIILYISSVFSVLKAGNPFPHYLMLTIVPLYFLAILSVGIYIKSDYCKNSLALKYSTAALSVALLIFFAPVLLESAKIIEPIKKSSVAVEIERIMGKVGSFAVWGWHPLYYVETGYSQGTRYAHTYTQLYRHSPLNKYYIERYIYDLEKNKPKLLLDVIPVGHGTYRDHNVYGLHRYAEVYQYVAEHYDWFKDLDGVTFYLRKR